MFFHKCAVDGCFMSVPRGYQSEMTHCAVHAGSSPTRAVDDSYGCRHVEFESPWTPERPAFVGNRCPNVAVAGAIYCEEHLCKCCLGDCKHSDRKVLYPICAVDNCAWPRMADLQSLQSTMMEETPRSIRNGEELMLIIARYIVHLSSVPHICSIYGGFIRDYLLRGEPAHDLDVVVFPKGIPGFPKEASSDRQVALVRKVAIDECIDALLSALQHHWPYEQMLHVIRREAKETSKDYLVTLVLAPVGSSELGSVQVEYCLDGAYPPGEVDADINNLAVTGGTSLLPRDRFVPFSPPHTLRHVQNKEFAYVRQGGWKFGLSRLWKLHWRGWKRVAMIKTAGNESANWQGPPWAVCPIARTMLSE